ncbi:MAG: PPOX class F420-dependent oxidoreductase [Ktedonobacterales bacterium]
MQLSQAARAFLNEKRFAVLATVGENGVPHQTVMWYELRGDDIFMNTAAGRVKAANLRRESRVSVCVDDGYRYVTVTGAIELNEDQAVAQEDIRRLAIRYHGQQAGLEMARDVFSKQHRITLRLPVQNVIEYGLDGEA